MVANSITKQMTSSYRAVVAVGHKKTVTTLQNRHSVFHLLQIQSPHFAAYRPLQLG